MGIQKLKKQALALSIAGLAWQAVAADIPERDKVDLGDNFKIAILPDTQYLTFNYPEIFLKQTQWLRDHAAEQDIQFVIHVGDIVQKGQNEWEWEHANEAMQVLDDAGIPYSTTIGNHDIDKTASSWELVNAVNFVKHYGPHRFEGRDDFLGASEDGLVTAFRFSAPGRDFLILNMAIDPTEEHLEWGRNVLRDNPSLPTILVTHRLVGENGDLGFTNNVFSGFETYDPTQMWDKFISKENQIFMTINGHSSPAPSNGAYNIVRTNDSGLPVNQILVDYQNLYEDEETCSEVYPENCGEKSGKGYLRIMNIDLANNTISHRSYSPHIDELEGDGDYTNGEEGFFLDKWNHFDDYINFTQRFAEEVPSDIEQIDLQIEYDDPEQYGGNKWLTKTETSLPAGTYETITAKASPEVNALKGVDLDWEVSDSDVVMLVENPSNKEVLIQGLKPGVATITASTPGVDSNNAITVIVTEAADNIYALEVESDTALAGESVSFDLEMSSLTDVQTVEMKFTILTKTIEDDKVEVTDSVYIDTGVIEAKNGFNVQQQDGLDYTYEYLVDTNDPELGAMAEVTVLLDCDSESCDSQALKRSIANITFDTNPDISTGKASKDDSYTEIDITRLRVNGEPLSAHPMEATDRVAFKAEYPFGDIAGGATAGEFISDTKIDLADLAMVQRYMGSKPSDEYWDHIRWGSKRADVSGNKVIDMDDFNAIFELMDENK